MIINNIDRSNPSISHSLTNSKVGVLPGHPGLTESSIQSSDKEEKQSTPQIISKSSEITIGGKLSKLGNMRPKKDLRYRYHILKLKHIVGSDFHLLS